MKLKIVKLPFKIRRPILALGPQTKNTVSFLEGSFGYVSPVHADLDNPKDFQEFDRTVKYFLKKNPQIIACDLHPEYQSTKYSQNLQLATYDLRPIQHHHAHIASCMAENGLKNQKVIGVAFDGTGLSSDGNLWGGEFLVCNYGEFRRAAHLKEIPLLGGERAILEPARVAACWLYPLYKDKFLSLDLIKKMDRNKWNALKNMYLSGFNSPLASSMGRLFDAVGSLVLGKPQAKFEAELAIELEKLAKSQKSPAQRDPALYQNAEREKVRSHKFRIMKEKNTYILDPLPMFKEIIAELKRKWPKEKIAYRFHLTVAEMIRKMCLILREENKINKAALSGGVFQNKLLLCMTLDLLYKEDFKVFTHKNLPCNDSSISFGEAIAANFSRRAMESRLKGR